MHKTTSTALVFILAAMFASSSHARPTRTRGRWHIKNIVRPSSFETEFLDSIVLRQARPKRQAIGTTVSVNVRLQSKYGWFLAIKDNGDVEGSLNFSSPNVILRLESVGKSLLRIYGIKAKKYLAMDSRGKLYSSSLPSRSTLFNQYMGASSFHTFSSATHLSPSRKLMYVALRDNGQPKKGSRTKKTHKSTQFLVLQLSQRL